MVILGIDPGIGRTGWGIIEKRNGNPVARCFGCIETTQKLSVEKRLQSLSEQISTIIAQEKPDAIAIEELFFNTNVTTAIAVGQARGVILLAAAIHDLPVTVYTPSQVKIAVTGYGKADKRQVGTMIKAILKLPRIPTPDDTADALAIALTHAFSLKMPVVQ